MGQVSELLKAMEGFAEHDCSYGDGCATEESLRRHVRCTGCTARAALAATDPCLLKVRYEEPVFILRAQDKLAPKVVRFWIVEVLKARGYSIRDLGRLITSPEFAKYDEADQLAKAMEAWQRAHPDLAKIPD